MDTAAYLTLPANASTFTRLRLAVKTLRILADDPANPYYGPFLNACLDGETYAKMARTWREQAKGRELLDERPSLQGRELDLEALARLPEGTLGRELARYFEANGIQPFVSAFHVASDVDYLSQRYRETHDIFHVLTGYGTDEHSEMELQAFVLGNLKLRQAIVILAFSVPRHFPQLGLRGVRPYFRRLRAAYRRGKQSTEMLSVPYEGMWERPVSELIEQLCKPG